MSDNPRIWVDFMKVDNSRRLVLTAQGTLSDLQRNRVELREGVALQVYSDDADDRGHPDPLLAEGVVHYDADKQRWVLDLDWSAIRHASGGAVRGHTDRSPEP